MFEGTHTAIVTPFDQDGRVNIDQFRALIDWQIDEGVSGIVPVGTTGESPTLSMQEHEQVIEVAVEAARGRVLVIAGTGGNSTAEALELTRHAKEAGADATLQVTPYYNKPSQQGLYAHFSAVADLGLPVVLYNVPGRSGTEIDINTVVRLAEHPHVIAIKEAAGSVDRVSRIQDGCDIEVLSGDDGLTWPMMAVGAVGVISVAANLIPGVMANLTQAALAGEFETARNLHQHWYRLFDAMFIDTNPIPVKAALAAMGMIQPVYRLPLCPLADADRENLLGVLRHYDLVKS